MPIHLSTACKFLMAFAAVAFAASYAQAETARDLSLLRTGWQLQDASLVSDDGATLSSLTYGPLHWHAAIVPGTVLGSLVADGTYPDPNYGLNNHKIPDTLCRTPWWYRTTFDVPATQAGRKLWLRFDGINYTADVWVNGARVGEIDGAFARGIFDITAAAKPGANVLAVELHPQPHPGEAHKRSQLEGVGRNGGISAIDGPTFLSSIGWDWQITVADRCTGIWQDVSLYSTGPVIIQNPYVTTTLPLPRIDFADITARATLCNTTAAPVDGILHGTIDDTRFDREVSLAAGEVRDVSFAPDDVPGLHVLNPKLWWPNGFGPQNLHTLHLTFDVGRSTSDASDTRFGIRQIGYALPGSDNLALVVNGVPVMAKGGDWALDESMKRIGRDRLDAELRMHQQAHYTIIRNWVGQSTSEDFYELCDKYGLLIWDEFFQPNPGDGPNPTDEKRYLANVKEKLLRFRNHPSIALWCARNEGFPPKSIGDGIKSLIDQYDSVRLYQASSTDGRGVRSSGPYYWREPRYFYDVREAFKTETGSMSVPTLEAVKAMIPPSSWNTVDDTWAMRDFCSGAQGGGGGYLDAIAKRYGEISSLADFVRKSQLANYEAFRAMYEGRFAKLFRPATGVITWMSNPSQPSFVWQLYSHDLEPNAALFATQKACEPVHVQLNEVTGAVEVINNTPVDIRDLQVAANLYDLDGKIIYMRRQRVSADKSACTELQQLIVAKPPVYFVKLWLTDSNGKLLSDNFYWRGTSEDELASLDSMPTAALQITTHRADADDRCKITVDLTNPTKAIALMAHLQLRRATSGRRVLPVTYEDNYVSLVAGEKRTITVEAATADLHGEQPLVAVDGWNVDVGTATGDVRVIPNITAFAHSLPPDKSPPPAAIRIDCGGNGTAGPMTFGHRPDYTAFLSDRDDRNGTVAITDADINVSVAHAAPAAIYRTERWGPCSYTIPVAAGRAYTVRLHFAEHKFDAGGRRFDVLLNNVAVLRQFDIAAEAGRDKALVKEFAGIRPNANQKITVVTRRGSADEPKICGIDVVAEDVN